MRQRGRIVLIICILLPVIFLIVLRFGKNKYKELPHFGTPKGITEKGDTLFHTVPPFSFYDQDRRSFGSEDLKGKIYVADFFFTRCPSICPTLLSNLKKVSDAFPKSGVNELNFVCFSVDPNHDSVEVLKKYADKNKISDKRWHFLTGNRDSIYDLMNTKGFLILKPEPNEEPAKFNHSGIISLVDPDGCIRGQYDGTNDEEIDRLVGDIQLLRVKYVKDRANK